MRTFTHLLRPRRLLPLLLLPAAVLLPALAPHGADAARDVLDMGRFTVSRDSQVMRVEDFVYERQGDSLIVRAASALWREPGTNLHFDKRAVLIVEAHEYDVLSYASQLETAADTLRRGLSIASGDTAFALWRETRRGGVGDVMAVPPGRMYVLDAPLFSLFGFVGWTLRDRTPDHWPLHALVLGARDTLVEATVTDAGTQDLNWHGQTVSTHKLVFGDQQTSIAAWFTRDGHMLRLEQTQAGIRVERDAPPAEPARPAPAPAKTAPAPAKKK